MATSEPREVSEQNKPLPLEYSFDLNGLLIPLEALKYAEVTGTISYTVVQDEELNRMRGMKE